MKRLIVLILGLLWSLTALADNEFDALLNKVTLQLQAEQWVTTKDALVNVQVDAALTDSALESLRSQVIDKLNKMATGEWHIVAFDRQQNKAELESVQILAQARLPQSSLASLRNMAKSVSKPGEKYTITHIQFVPSEEEIRQANVALRANIYQQAKAEIDALNKIYPGQKYYLHRMNFMSLNMPMPMIQQRQAMFMEKMSMSASLSSAPLTVGNKQTLTATVELAAISEIMVPKLATAKSQLL